jgi:hypothetical protein
MVPVHDLAVKEGDLVAGTHGRSFWILDDLSALRQMTPAVVAKRAHLFAPRDAYRTQFGGGRGRRRRAAGGAEPGDGAAVYYWVKQPNQEVTLEFMDAKGAVIKRFTSRQDSLTVRDSLRGDSVRLARRDSLSRTGLSADSVTKLEAASEGSGESGGGGDDEDGPRRAPRPAARAEQGGAQHLRLEPALPRRQLVRQHDPLGGRHPGAGGAAGRVRRAHGGERRRWWAPSGSRCAPTRGRRRRRPTTRRSSRSSRRSATRSPRRTTR